MIAAGMKNGEMRPGPPCRSFECSRSITSNPPIPLATYTPETGFAGEDEFSYEAIAKGNIDQQVRLRVRVKVNVLAP